MKYDKIINMRNLLIPSTCACSKQNKKCISSRERLLIEISNIGDRQENVCKIYYLSIALSAGSFDLHEIFSRVTLTNLKGSLRFCCY